MEDEKLKYLLLLGLLLLCGCSTVTEPVATAPETTEGKITQKYANVTVSRLLRVIDGDTFACDIDTHSPIAGKNISIRLRGINTPELRDKDPVLRKSAYEEKERLEQLLTSATMIELRDLGRDKYFRILASVYIDGEALLPKLNHEYHLY
ncbi:thermonuclease family protein [bacterium]|nr:thermonuclease family protein [bacterium]